MATRRQREKRVEFMRKVVEARQAETKPKKTRKKATKKKGDE